MSENICFDVKIRFLLVFECKLGWDIHNVAAILKKCKNIRVPGVVSDGAAENIDLYVKSNLCANFGAFLMKILIGDLNDSAITALT